MRRSRARPPSPQQKGNNAAHAYIKRIMCVVVMCPTHTKILGFGVTSSTQTARDWRPPALSSASPPCFHMKASVHYPASTRMNPWLLFRVPRMVFILAVSSDGAALEQGVPDRGTAGVHQLKTPPSNLSTLWGQLVSGAREDTIELSSFQLVVRVEARQYWYFGLHSIM